MTNGVSLRERRKKGSRLKREIQQRKEIDFFLSLEQCSRNSIFKEGDFFTFFFFSLDIGDSARDSAFGSFKIGAIDVKIGQVYFSVVFSFRFEN